MQSDDCRECIRIVWHGAVCRSTHNVRWSVRCALSACSAAANKWRANCDRHGTHAGPCIQPKQKWHSHHVGSSATVLKPRCRKAVQRHAAGGNYQLVRSCTLQESWNLLTVRIHLGNLCSNREVSSSHVRHVLYFGYCMSCLLLAHDAPQRGGSAVASCSMYVVDIGNLTGFDSTLRPVYMHNPRGS
jgi:hypothetical protein